MEGIFSHQTRTCFMCEEDAEYYCKDCGKNFCLLCKEEHLIEREFYFHKVVNLEVKNRNTCEETCKKHPRNVYKYWCPTCQCPLCKQCIGHRRHGTNLIESTYRRHLSQSREQIVHIRSTILPYNIALLAQIRDNILASSIARDQLKFNRKMTERVESIKNALNSVQSLKNIAESVNQLKKQVSVLERSMYKIEIYANKPVQYLMFLKTSSVFPYSFSKISQYAVKRQNVINMFGAIENINECLFEVLPDMTLNRSIEVDEIQKCLHISCVSPDRLWINNHEKLLFVSSKNGKTLFCQKGILTGAEFPCVHSVTTTGDLIFIDQKRNICELEKEQTIPRVLIKKSKPWKPCSVFCSLLNGNLLIGMWRQDTDASKVSKYDRKGTLIKNFQYHENGESLYKKVLYITENQNGDVIVSDIWYGVVVVNRKGAHRFSYKGPPSVRKLSPNGICTDALMNILVCDYNTNSVHMTDKDGRFLRYLLIKNHNIMEPRSICYDNKNHLVWVDSNLKDKLNLFCYRYINRKSLLSFENVHNDENRKGYQ